MVLHRLEIATPDALCRAFRLLHSAETVETCLVEPDGLCIRFSASRPEAALLIRRIAARGGLVAAHCESCPRNGG